MEKPKKQHYVPQFYLKHWSPLYCYDKLKDKSFPTSHRDAGQENYFYEIEGLPTGTLEKLLATGEGRFSQAYNKLATIKDLKKLTRSERASFFLFLAVQVFRTYEERFSFKEQSDKVLDAVFGKTGMNLIPGDLKISYSEESIKKIQLEMLIEGTPKIAKILSEKVWVIKENHTDVPLLTSDNPVALHNQLQFQDGWGNLGLLSPGIEIHVPLKPNLILFSYDQRTHKVRDGNMTADNVRRHNSYQVTNSTRFLYSKLNDFTLERKFLEKFPKFKKPDRSRGTFTIKKGENCDFLIFDKKETIQ